MLLFRRITILFFIFLGFTQSVYAITFSSVQSGPWNDPVTWGQAVMFPNSTDDVVVNSGHTVNINSDTYINSATISGTLNFVSPSYMLNLGGDIVVNGNLSGGGLLLFTGSNIQTIGGSASSMIFNTLAISKGGGHVQLGRNIEVTGDLNISTGILNAGPFFIDVGGNFMNYDTFNSGTGVVRMIGPGTQNIGGTAINLRFNILSINKSPGQTVTLQRNIEIDNAINIFGGTFDGGSNLIDMYGDLNNNDQFISTGTVEFRGGTIDTIAGTGTYNLRQLNVVQNSVLYALQTITVAMETWIDVGSKLDIGLNTTHDLKQLTGTGILALTAAPVGSAVFCTGDYSVFGGTVEFNGPNSYSIPADFPGSYSFTNVIIRGAGVKTLAVPMNILNNFTVETGAQFIHDSGLLEVNDFINRGGYTDKLVNATILKVRGILDNQPGGIFAMESRAEVSGNLNNSGNWPFKNTSVLAFTGMGNSTVSGNAIQINDLIIQRTSTSMVNLTSPVIINNTVAFQGDGKLFLNSDLTLRPTANITPSVFSNLRGIFTITGSLIVEGNNPSELAGIYPIGTAFGNGEVSIPSTFLMTQGAGVSQIKMKAMDYSIASDYASRSLSIQTANITSVTDFKFDFTSPGMFIGSPNTVFRKVGATKNAVSGAYVDIANEKFGVSGNGNNFIDGEWISEALAMPTISSVSSPGSCVGDSVDIHGSGFSGTTLVEIGTTPAPFVLKSDVLIRFVAVANASGNIRVTTGAGGVSGPGFITSSPPAVTVGADQTICSNGSATLSATLSAGAALIWSGGTGTFSPGISDPNAIYSPGPSDIVAGSVTLIATASAGSCSTATDDIIIFLNAEPTVDAVGPISACAGQVINLNSILGGSATSVTWTGGNGSFTPVNTDFAPGYQLVAADESAGTITITATTEDPIGPCDAVFDQLIVSVIPSPTVTLTGDQTICEGGAPAILQATFTGSGPWSFELYDGTNTTPMNASVSPFDFQVSPTSTTIYNIPSAIDAGCGTAASAAITVTVIPSVTATLSGDQNICTGGSALLTVNFTGTGPWDFTYDDGTGPISVNGINVNPYEFSANPTANTTYTLNSVSVGPCSGMATGSAIVNVVAPPSATLTGDQTVCSGETASMTVDFTGIGPWDFTYDLGTGPIPVTASVSPFFFDVSPTTNTLVMLTSVSENGCSGSGSGSAGLTVIQSPGAILSGDTTICDGGTAILSVDFTGTGPWDFTYNDGLGDISFKGIVSAHETFAVFPVSTSTYTAVSVTSGCMAAATGNAVVTVNPIAFATAGGDQVICSSDTPTLEGTVGGSATTGLWTGGGGTFNPDAAAANAVYTPSPTEVNNQTVALTWTNTDGCGSISDDVIITINPGPTASAGTDQVICDNVSSVGLSGSMGGASSSASWTSSGGGTFSPDNSTLNANYLPSSTDASNGSVTLTLTNPGDGTCAPAVSTMLITFTPSPILTLGVTPAEDTLCAGANGLITIMNSEADVNYQADLGGTPVSSSLLGNNGDLELTLINGSFTAGVDNVLNIKAVRAGCVTTVLTATPIIRKSTLTAPSISAASGTQLCTGNPVILTAPAGFSNYQWYRGTSKIADATGLNYSTLISGTYSLQVSDGLCKPVSSSINVNLVSPEPVITTSGTTLSTTASSSYYQWYVESAPGDSKAINGANSSSCPVYFNAKYFVAIKHNNCRLVSVPVTVNDGGLNPLLRKNYQILNDSSILILPPSSEEEIILYPNPAEDAFTVDYKCISSGTVLIELFNSMGDKIISRTITPISGTVNESFDRLNVQPGIYLISVTEGNKRVVRNIQIN